MRGKEAGSVLCDFCRRITPAYAGKRVSIRQAVVNSRDHPRVCGEKQRGVKDMKAAGGSPPRMRGKAEQQQSPVHLQRITPAYAGKSSLRGSRACSGRDHPRVCGEKFRAYAKVWNEWGSPPRMRGKVNAKSVPTAGTGITPAYAGKSTKDRGQDPGHRDHPRVCGEKLTVLPCLPLKSGSPPRMRGKD